MSVLLWIILVITWLASVVYTFYIGIKEKKGDNLPYTIRNAVADFFFGSLGAGLIEIIFWCGEKAFRVGIGFVVCYILKLASPILNKRIL